MAAPGIAPHANLLRIGAVSLVVVSGACALAALVAGSPLQFGLALALCGAAWIAADYIERAVERAPARLEAHTYAPPRVVYIGGRVHLSRPDSRIQTRLAA